MKTEMFHIRMSAEHKAKLEQQAKDAYRTMADHVAYLIDQEQKRIDERTEKK